MLIQLGLQFIHSQNKIQEYVGYTLLEKAFDKQKEVRSMGGSQTTVDRTANQYKITNFLKQHVVFNKKIAKLPRFLVDPFVRY